MITRNKREKRALNDHHATLLPVYLLEANHVVGYRATSLFYDISNAVRDKHILRIIVKIVNHARQKHR